MQQDCVVVGASFAGLACATALAGAGARVTVLERKHDPGVKLHTTGILVPGMVSPVTAGGIHLALKHGLATGHAIADFLSGRRADPAVELHRTYRRFRAKRLLRFLFDHFQSDLAFNLLLSTAPVRQAPSLVYFHRRGVFDAPQRARAARHAAADQS